MSSREEKEIKVGAHIFLVKTYATAREAQAIQQAYFKGAKVEVRGEQPHIAEFDPSVQFVVQQEMVAQMVVSLDGVSEDIVNRCLDLQSGVYDELIRELDTLVAKKNS